MCYRISTARCLSYFARLPGLRGLSRRFFFFNDTATTEIYTLSLHDALPISTMTLEGKSGLLPYRANTAFWGSAAGASAAKPERDKTITRGTSDRTQSFLCF